jgi:SAM-dependent methyltransferase
LTIGLDAVGEGWLRRAEARYLADLTFPEVTRALRALSSCYVERRSRLASGAALSTAGKRAAFALFYGPLHYLTVTALARALPSGGALPATVVDLGCGTGASGAAWARGVGAEVAGYDVNPWAVREAQWSYAALGVRGTSRRAGVDRVRWPRGPADILAAFVLNEMTPDARELARSRLFDVAGRGLRVLVIEPLARGAAPWWPAWERDVLTSGGRSDEWRFPVELPDLVARLDRSAGLDHRELTARSLALGFS